MSKLVAKSINTEFPNEGGADIYKAINESYDLTIFIEFRDTNECVKVEFKNIIGYRALDDSDLFDWWNFINLKVGWCFEIESGGWKELEETRSDFMSAGNEKLNEFLVISNDTCFNILCYDKPNISKDT